MAGDIDTKKYPIGLSMIPKRMPPQRIFHQNLIRRYAILQYIRKEEGPEITQKRLDEIDEMLAAEQLEDIEFMKFHRDPENIREDYDECRKKWDDHRRKWREENKEELCNPKYHDKPLWGWQPNSVRRDSHRSLLCK